jgi:hypothetical protein
MRRRDDAERGWRLTADLAVLSIVHPVIPCPVVALFFLRRNNFQGAQVMKNVVKLLISFSLLSAVMTGCVVAPAGYYHRGYYGPRMAVVAPAPVIVVRP